MLKTLLAVGLTASLLVGCSDTSSPDRPPTPTERANRQAKREFDICMKQADRMARTDGADAASAHMDSCVDNFANSAQVED